MNEVITAQLDAAATKLCKARSWDPNDHVGTTKLTNWQHCRIELIKQLQTLEVLRNEGLLDSL